MQRALLIAALCGSFPLCVVPAQIPSAADLLAARQELEEEGRIIKSDITALQQRQDTFDKKMQQMVEQVNQLRLENAALKEALARAGGNQATREELKHLVERIQEVDRKRADDKELILREMRELAKLSSAIPAPAPPVSRVSDDRPRAGKSAEKPAPAPEAPAEEYTGEHFVHVVEKGQTLDEIIVAYNKAHGLKVKRSDVLKANPKLKDPKRLFVGQKLKIPAVR